MGMREQEQVKDPFGAALGRKEEEIRTKKKKKKEKSDQVWSNQYCCCSRLSSFDILG